MVKMIVGTSEITKYLDDYKNGRIAYGDGIGVSAIDDYMRFKKGNFNMILGHDNTGKTTLRTWYYLVLSVKYNYKWCIWTGENKAGQIVRNLIQYLSGKYLKQLTISEIYRYEQQISQWFSFVDNSKLYKYKELLKVFDGDNYTGCLIDPYTGLDREYTHSSNYDFLNETRQWVNKTGKTIDVCTHPSSASGRAQGMYPKGHEWEGHLKEPYKSDVEGGKPFANRADDFYVIHRLPKHPTMSHYALLFVDKVKDEETGGKNTQFGNPVMLDFNKGLGYLVGGINPLFESEYKGEYKEPATLEANYNFDTELNIEDDGMPF